MTNYLNKTKDFFLGLLIGSLTGAAAVMLLAPQSGRQTRTQIQLKSLKLRGRAADRLKKDLAEIRVDARKVTADVGEKARQLKHLGQDKLIEQVDNVTSVIVAGIMTG